MGFQHQITGADSAPLVGVVPLQLQEEGCPAGRHRRQGCPGGQVERGEVLALLPPALGRRRDGRRRGRKADRPRARSRRRGPARLAGTADAAIDAQLRRFARARARLAPDVRTRRWVFMLQSPEVTDLFDYLGGRVKPTEAELPRVHLQVFLSDPKTGIVEPGTDDHRSRIVLGRNVLGDPDVAVDAAARDDPRPRGDLAGGLRRCAALGRRGHRGAAQRRERLRAQLPQQRRRRPT